MIEQHEIEYEQVKEASWKSGESRDCTVRSIALTTGEGYEMAHYALEEQGRVRRMSTSICSMFDACKSLGYKMERMKPEEYAGAKTAISAARMNLPGRYILSFSGHVAAMIDGKVLDWTEGRRHRIERIYRVTKG